MKRDEPVIGLFAIGLEAYWSQFPKMKKKLENLYKIVLKKIEKEGKVLSAGIVDSHKTARKTGAKFSSEGVDIIFCYCATYSTSSNMLPVVSDNDVPVILLNLQPVASLNNTKINSIGDWLSTCTSACIPEMTAVLTKNQVIFDVITGLLENDDIVNKEIKDWCQAARVSENLKNSKIGIIGHPYSGMMDLYIDETNLYKRLKIFPEFVEMDMIKKFIEKTTSTEVNKYKSLIKKTFSYNRDVEDKMDLLAKSTAAISKLCSERKLNSLSYHYSGLNFEQYENIIATANVVFSILTSRGIPCSVEGDIKVSIAMRILKIISGVSNLVELYSMDFNKDLCIMGHSGPIDNNISNNKATISMTEVFHGKSGKGFLTKTNIKEGPVTIIALTENSNGGFKIVAAEGKCVSGSMLDLGDTNAAIKFPIKMRNFVNRWSKEGPTHHGAITIGNQTDVLEKTAKLLDIDFVSVCKY